MSWKRSGPHQRDTFSEPPVEHKRAPSQFISHQYQFTRDSRKGMLFFPSFYLHGDEIRVLLVGILCKDDSRHLKLFFFFFGYIYMSGIRMFNSVHMFRVMMNMCHKWSAISRWRDPSRKFSSEALFFINTSRAVKMLLICLMDHIACLPPPVRRRRRRKYNLFFIKENKRSPHHHPTGPYINIPTPHDRILIVCIHKLFSFFLPSLKYVPAKNPTTSL